MYLSWLPMDSAELDSWLTRNKAFKRIKNITQHVCHESLLYLTFIVGRTHENNGVFLFLQLFLGFQVFLFHSPIQSCFQDWSQGIQYTLEPFGLEGYTMWHVCMSVWLQVCAWLYVFERVRSLAFSGCSHLRMNPFFFCRVKNPPVWSSTVWWWDAFDN